MTFVDKEEGQPSMGFCDACSSCPAAVVAPDSQGLSLTKKKKIRVVKNSPD